MDDLKTGNKLILAFGAQILGFLALLALATASLRQIQEAEDRLYERDFRSITVVKDVLANTNEGRARLLGIFLTDDAAEIAHREGDILRLSAQNETLLAELRGIPTDKPELATLEEEFQRKHKTVIEARDRSIMPLIRDRKLDEARALIMHGQAERIAEFRELGERLNAAVEREAESRLQANTRLAETQQRLFLGVGAALIGLAVFTIWRLTRDIAQPLVQLTLWARRISVGELPEGLADTRREDEVGQLQQAFRAMSDYLQTMTGRADAIARGELSREVATAAEKDVLGTAFARMSQYLLGLSRQAERIAQGDLSQEVRPQSEADVLGKAFAAMAANLRRLTQELHEGINVLASASQEILNTTTQLASSTQETATAINEIATTVQEVKQTAQLASDKARTVSESAQRTVQVSLSGRQAVDVTLERMNQIRDQVQAVAESIMRLSEQSQAIAEIVATVNDLAEQSNLLGVNASIEAVKAGDQGKGFSVVAQEVKALADQSKQATAQVRAILADVQKAMTKTVLATEQSAKAVDSGYAQAEQSGDAIRALADSIGESSGAALQIAASSQQQLVGTEQIAVAMDNIRVASQDNVAGTKQTEAAARDLHQLGQRLKQLAGQFQL